MTFQPRNNKDFCDLCHKEVYYALLTVVNGDAICSDCLSGEQQMNDEYDDSSLYLED